MIMKKGKILEKFLIIFIFDGCPVPDTKKIRLNLLSLIFLYLFPSFILSILPSFNPFFFPSFILFPPSPVA